MKNYFGECLFKPSNSFCMCLYISDLQVKEANASSSLAPKKYCHSKLQESWSSKTCANFGQINTAF